MPLATRPQDLPFKTAGEVLNQPLSQDGAGSVFSMNVNGSVTPVTFSATPAAGTHWYVERMILALEDGTAFAPNTFGAVAALTNGVSVQLGGTEFANWKDNFDINLSMYDFEGREVFGKADTAATGRWTFSKQGGPLLVTPSQTLDIVVQDNLTGLVDFLALIQGRIKS